MRLFSKLSRTRREGEARAPRSYSASSSDCPACGDLSWVDTFIRNVRPYLFVRIEDNLLIKRPNTAQKLNESGARLLSELLGGKSLHEVIGPFENDAEKVRQISLFLHAIRQQIEGTLDPFSGNPAVDVIPFDMNFSRYPVLSEVALTYRCNLRCSFCYAGCNRTGNPTNSAGEMNFEECKTVLNKLFHQARVPSVSFTGGEPTLCDYLPALIGYAKELGMRVNLITNGTLIDADRAAVLADHGLDSAQVSLEGITADVHDRITGGRGSFHQSIAAVRHLRNTGILVHTNTTINRENLFQSDSFPAFVTKELACTKFSMNLIIPTGSARINAATVVSYREIGPWLERIIEASRLNDVEFMWYSPVPMCMFNSIIHGLGNKGCSACDGLISIGANGDVLPCASYDDSVGNLIRQDFDTIWQSEKACYYRDKKPAPDECRRCENFHICNGACPLYWRQEGYSELLDVLQLSPAVT